jgi:hypothetical protein
VQSLVSQSPLPLTNFSSLIHFPLLRYPVPAPAPRVNAAVHRDKESSQEGGKEGNGEKEGKKLSVGADVLESRPTGRGLRCGWTDSTEQSVERSGNATQFQKQKRRNEINRRWQGKRSQIHECRRFDFIYVT